MLKQIDSKQIKKWTELNVMGKPVKRVYIKSEQAPIYSVADLAPLMHDDCEKMSPKDWDNWLNQFATDEEEYILIGNKDMSNLYVSQPVLENSLLNVDYTKASTQELKKKRTLYAHVIVNPTEYTSSVNKSSEGNKSFKCYLASLKTHKKRALPFKGVYQNKNKYIVNVYKGLNKSFDTMEEAAQEYDRQVYQKYGDQVIPYLNFPDVYKKQADNTKTTHETSGIRLSVDLERYIDLKVSQKVIEIYKEINDILVAKLRSS